MGAITTARNALKTDLAGTGYVVYGEPAETMVTPSLVVVPASDYVAAVTLGANPRLHVTFEVWLQVAWRDNAAALLQLENLIDKVLAAMPSGVLMGAFGQPQRQTVGASEMLVTSIEITTAI